MKKVFRKWQIIIKQKQVVLFSLTLLLLRMINYGLCSRKYINSDHPHSISGLYYIELNIFYLSLLFQIIKYSLESKLATRGSINYN